MQGKVPTRSSSYQVCVLQLYYQLVPSSWIWMRVADDAIFCMTHAFFHTEDPNNPNWDTYTEAQIATHECIKATLTITNT